MKKQITILAVAILFMATISNATVWRVNNRANMDSDFATLQDAINGSSAGDTLYIGGSTFSYGHGVFDKQLVVIGNGYWLDENDTTQAFKQNSQVGKLTFNAGSEGSIVQGLYIYYSSQQQFYLITINTDSITIKKNHLFVEKKYNGSGSGYDIYISGSRSDIIIMQNWITAFLNSSHNNDKVYCVIFIGNPINCKVSNNFIRAYRSGSSGGDYYALWDNNNSSNNLMVVNNVFWGNVTTYYTEHINNILVSGSYYNGIGNETFNNICNGTQFPDINNNQRNVDMSTVFVDYEKYIDNGYILANGSPAIGSGFIGGDCGVYSNDWGGVPYVLSGMPEIPAIFEATIPSFGTSTLPVNIKATSHNANK